MSKYEPKKEEIETKYSKNAQAAIEYLMISGFVFVILLPLVYLVFNYTQESTAEIIDSQITKIGFDIVNTAESVYYYSDPSKITLDINMPVGVVNMSIVSNDPATDCVRCNELRFVVQKIDFKQTIPIPSKIDIRSQDYYDESYPHLSRFNRSFYSPGIKKFKIEAKTDHVLVSLG